MKKMISLLGGISVILLLAINAYSGQYTQGTVTDDTVTVPVTAVTNADPIVFQKSARVIISGNSAATNFAHAAHHAQVVGKKNGRQFGMTGEVSNIFWMDIETNTPINVTVTTSAAFANFSKM